MYKVKDERGNLKGMKSLYAKRTHLMKDGPLFGYYDGVIVHGTMCEDCQLGSKHPIELSTDETLLAPLYVELNEPLGDQVHPAQMIAQKRTYAQWVIMGKNQEMPSV